MAGFKSGRYPVLVATDIAARGIDVEALSHVVNFDVPAAPDDYIHRVGRTGRAEMTGEAFTFVTPQDEGDWRAIERAIGRTLPRVTLPDFNYQAAPAKPLEIPMPSGSPRFARAKPKSGREPERTRSAEASHDPPLRHHRAPGRARRRSTRAQEVTSARAVVSVPSSKSLKIDTYGCLTTRISSFGAYGCACVILTAN